MNKYKVKEVKEKIRIKVQVSWTDYYFCCVWNDKDAGTVLVIWNYGPDSLSRFS